MLDLKTLKDAKQFIRLKSDPEMSRTLAGLERSPVKPLSDAARSYTWWSKYVRR